MRNISLTIAYQHVTNVFVRDSGGCGDGQWWFVLLLGAGYSFIYLFRVPVQYYILVSGLFPDLLYACFCPDFEYFQKTIQCKTRINQRRIASVGDHRPVSAVFHTDTPDTCPLALIFQCNARNEMRFLTNFKYNKIMTNSGAFICYLSSYHIPSS